MFAIVYAIYLKMKVSSCYRTLSKVHIRILIPICEVTTNSVFCSLFIGGIIDNITTILMDSS